MIGYLKTIIPIMRSKTKINKKILIKEHINYYKTSSVSNYSKTDIRSKQASFDVSEILNDERLNLQNISSLQNNLRDQRNIINNLNSFHKPSPPLQTTLKPPPSSYIKSYFKGSIPPTTLNTHQKLPPIHSPSPKLPHS